MTASLTAAPTRNANMLTSLYTLRCADEILGFVNTHSFLYPLLLEAPEHIQSIFGAGVRLTLELSHDHEVPVEAQLFIIIRMSETQDEALKKLRTLDSGWWRTVFRAAQSKLSIDVEIGDAF